MHTCSSGPPTPPTMGPPLVVVGGHTAGSVASSESANGKFRVQCALIRIAGTLVEAHEDDVFYGRISLKAQRYGSHSDLRGLLQGIALRSGADRGKCQSANAVFRGESERAYVAAGQEVRFARAPALPDRADCMYDILGGQSVSFGNDGIASVAASNRPALGK